MVQKKLSRAATAARGALVAYLAPRLAADAKIDLNPLLTGIKASTLKAKRETIVSGVVNLTKGKLAKDASIETKDLGKLLDVINVLEPKDDAMDDLDPNAAMPAGGMKEPRAKMREYLQSKGMSAEDIKACDDMFGDRAMDADETEEEKKAREAKEAEAAKSAKDAEMDKEEKVDKNAMDAAIRAATTATRASVMKEVRANEREIRDAEREVEPFVGRLAVTFDTAEQVRRHALEMLGVPEAKTIHASALSTILQMQQKPGARPAERDRGFTMDAQATSDFNSRFPDAARIGAA